MARDRHPAAADPRATRTYQAPSNCRPPAPTLLVHYLDSNDAGPGFYALAQQYGLLSRRASKATKETFWVGQASAVHDLYARNA